ncbi:MAG: undecaprenyl-diphosphate phosphatase [Patescibacteria group bacterium]|nr:undecaprenyl-diphosphate phosphatase [Patescibacteria group bacterium]
MFNFISAVVLGLVEGVTEFLPVSSTGHLILINQWFSFGEPFTKLFDIVIQSGAILAVIVLFWKDVWPSDWRLEGLKEKWGAILSAFIPTAVIGLLFGKIAEKYLFTPTVVALALIFYGIVFLILEKRDSRNEKSIVTFGDAAIIGLIQALALVPGTSRSGATIIGMLILGYTRPVAAKFSFLLAIPTLIAAGGYSLLKYDASISSSEWLLLFIGFIASFASAFLVVKWFMTYISRKSFVPFAWYRLILGLAVILFVIWG